MYQLVKGDGAFELCVSLSLKVRVFYVLSYLSGAVPNTTGCFMVGDKREREDDVRLLLSNRGV